MEEYKGKKIEPKEIENITLDNSPHYFIEGKYIGFCNSDGLPHGLGELIAPPTDAKLNKERNIIEVTKRNDHNKTPWSCNGEWEDGVFIKGTYNMPPFSRHQGEFIFKNEDWVLTGEGVELHYHSDDNYNNDNVIGHVKGIFDNGTLLKGEVTNAFKIRYVDEDFIKKIIIKGNSKKKTNPQGHFGTIKIGEIFFENGDQYEGEIDYDMPQGEGTMTHNDGTKITGIWKDGNFLRKKK